MNLYNPWFVDSDKKAQEVLAAYISNMQAPLVYAFAWYADIFETMATMVVVGLMTIFLSALIHPTLVRVVIMVMGLGLAARIGFKLRFPLLIALTSERLLIIAGSFLGKAYLRESIELASIFDVEIRGTQLQPGVPVHTTMVVGFKYGKAKRLRLSFWKDGVPLYNQQKHLEEIAAVLRTCGKK